MSKKYILQLSKNTQIPITIGVDTSQIGWVVTMLQKTLWTIWLFGLPLFTIFSKKPNVVITIGLYMFITISLGLLIIKNLFFKNTNSIVVPNDLLLLLFTTTLTTSLLITTLNENINYNIFGGPYYKMFSGISMMALSGLYYLFIYQNKTSSYLSKLNIYMVGTLIAIIFSALEMFNGRIYTGLVSTLIMLSPGLLWLSFKKNGFRYINLTLFVFSIIFLITTQNPYLYFVIAVIYIVTCASILLLNIKTIKDKFNFLIKDVKTAISKKKKVNKLLVKNTKIIFIITTGLISIISIVVWINTGSKIDLNGYLALSDGINLWIGRGLTGGQPSTVFLGMLQSTGLIVFIVFSMLITVMIKQMVKLTKYDVNASFFVITLISGVIHLLLLPVSELTIVSFWLLLGFSSLFYLQTINKHSPKLNLVCREYKLFTDKEFIKLNRLIPYILLVVIMFLIGYTIYILNNLIIFIK